MRTLSVRSTRALHDRSYRLYVPAHPAAPAALVVMLHGGYGSAQQAEASYGWDRILYPDGDGRAWNAGGGCCGSSARDGADDVAFIAAAVADVQKRCRSGWSAPLPPRSR